MPGILCCLMLFAYGDDPSPDDAATAQLAKVRRTYVDILTGGDSALQIRDLLMASLQGSKQFILTESEEKADAILKGAARDQVFTDLFQSSEGVNAHSQAGGGSNGSTKSSRPYMGLSVGENETHRTQERKHEAMATVRLVIDFKAAKKAAPDLPKIAPSPPAPAAK